MRKGLSPIISAILILLIAISVTLLAIIWLPKFIIKIFPQLGFNESYVRSRGCLSIENVKGLFGLFTIKNCGKVALSDFSFFIDNNFINKLNIGTLNPSQSIDFYDMPITGGRHSLYITADYAESPPYAVDVPYWECIGGEPILVEDWYVSKEISCICSYNTVIPVNGNVYVIENGRLSLYNCILQFEYMRIRDNGFLNLTKTKIRSIDGDVAFRDDSEAYIKDSVFNQVSTWFEHASNATVINSKLYGIRINSNIHHKITFSGFDAINSPITEFVKAEDSNFTINFNNVSFDYSSLQISDNSNTTVRNSRFSDFYIASEENHNLTVNNWSKDTTQDLYFKAQGSDFTFDAKNFYGGWTLFYGEDNSNNTVTNSIIGQIEAWESPNNTFINCSIDEVYLLDNSFNNFKNCNINDQFHFGFSWYDTDNFAKANFSNTTISNSISFDTSYYFPSRITNITFFGNVTFDSSAYINRFYANVTRNFPTIIKDSNNYPFPTLQPARVIITNKFNQTVWAGSVNGGVNPIRYYIEDPIILFNLSNYVPGNFNMTVSQVCENKTDVNFLNSTPLEFTINRSYNYDGTSFNTPQVGGTRRGIAFDNSYFWVASSNGNVSKYSSIGTYLWRFNSTLKGLRDVASNGTYLWLLNYNSSDKKVYRYRTSDYGYDNWNFDISAVIEAYAVDFDGNNFWVLSNTSVYKYSSTGVYTGFSFSLNRLAGVYFGDIVFNGGLWVLTENYSSSSGRGVFKYNPDGTYDNWYFDINPPTTTGRGLAYNGTYFWVMNSTGTVFRYSLNRNCLEIMKQCDEFVTFLPYTISKNNMRYCLLYNLYLPNKTAITFASSVQNTTLDCLGHNLNSNYFSGSFGVYLTGAGTNSNTIKNCNITNFGYGIRLYNGPSNNFITNNTAGSNSYGIVIDSSSNNIVANNTAMNNGGQGIIVFNSGQNNTIADNILINNYQNIHLCNGAANNIVIRNNITGGTYGIYVHDGAGGTASYNNLTYNNITSAQVGIYIVEGCHDNLFANSSVMNSGQYDYYLANATSNNSFINMNFTSSKKIYFNDTTSWFNYRNTTANNIWLKTNVSAQSNITRKLVNWGDALMQWNDTFSNTSGSITATYNISGLLPNINYTVYNNSILTYTFKSSSTGQISFTVYLPANQEHGIMVNRSNNVLNLNFNEANGTKVYDSSGYGNNGTLYGETFYDGTLGNGTAGTQPTRLSGSSCIYGNCLGFDGVPNAIADVVNISDFMPNSSLTVMAWIYPKQIYGDERAIVSKWGSNSEWLFRLSNATTAQLQFYIINVTGGWEEVDSTSANIQINNWYHVAAVYDRANRNVSFYVNGTPKGGGYFPYNGQTQNGADIVRIGAQSGGSFDPFNGTIDEVRIWNRSLTQAEIQAEMNSSMPTSRPIASWRFDEGSGNRANDTHIWVNGTYGSALSFDGVNDYALIPDSNSLDVSNITIAAWIYPYTWGGISGDYGRILDKSNAYLFFLAKDSNNNRLSFYYRNTTGSSYQSYSTGGSIQLNQWQFVSVTYDGQYVKFYVNGNPAGQATVTAKGPIIQTSNSLYVGNRAGLDRQFNGIIDELRIWNRILSQSEILAEMNKG
jgi:parallel beta-helix repeat protein